MMAILCLLVSTLSGLHHALTREPVSAFIAVSLLGLSWYVGNRTFK